MLVEMRNLAWSPASLTAVGSVPMSKPSGAGGIVWTLLGSPRRYQLETVAIVPPGLIASGCSSGKP